MAMWVEVCEVTRASELGVKAAVMHAAALFIHLHWLARLIGLSGLADRTSPGAIAGGLHAAPRIPVIHRKRCQAKTRYRGQDLPSPV